MATQSVLPRLPSRFPGDHLLAFRRDVLGFLQLAKRTCGDVAEFRLGPERTVLITHPDQVRDILVTHHRQFVKGRRGDVSKQFLGEGLLNSEGATHRRQRRLSQPAFHRQRLSAYATVMTEHSARLREHWREGETLDVAQAMMRLTLSIAGKTLFNTDVAAETIAIGNALSDLLMYSNRASLPLANIILKLPLPSVRRVRRAQQFLDTTIYRIIHERRVQDADDGDLLSMLLLAQDEAEDGASMTDKQVHDEALTLLLAGHETTAIALTWTWYLLSQHPLVEAKMHDELDAVLKGRLPAFDDLDRLTYTRMVLTESLRLYPPAWLMTRRNLEAYDLGDYLLPARTFILISPYLTQRDPRFFEAPEQFQPERWAQGYSGPKFAYFPFGGGPRQCIGEGFAWMEGLLVLATLAQRWRLQLVPGHPVGVKPLVTLRPEAGMRMSLVPHRQTPHRGVMPHGSK
jgi:cytochrome P450